jgi:hypothetical protein
MKRILKILLVVVATAGMTGYAGVPGGGAVTELHGRAPATTARAAAPALLPAPESTERSPWTLLLCGFLVVGFIARRKSRLLAP